MDIFRKISSFVPIMPDKSQRLEQLHGSILLLWGGSARDSKKMKREGVEKTFFYQGAEHSRVTILNRVLEVMKFYTCFLMSLSTVLAPLLAAHTYKPPPAFFNR